METLIPEDWVPWRSQSPLGDRRPTPAEVSAAAATGLGRQDVLPYPTDGQSAGLLRMLIVGINPSPWTAAVNAPFARPGNRFWTSLARGGVIEAAVDAACGLAVDDEHMLARRGIGITNLVSRPSARADELAVTELQAGGEHLVERLHVLRPRVVAVLGVTAFRTAFALPRAKLGRQEADTVAGWPAGVGLWVLPNPSGLNAHETVDSLALKWQDAWADSVSG